MTISPDRWVLLEGKVNEEDPFYKVLGGWSGGYLNGDSWRMNSGIKSFDEDDTHVNFVGYSGSIYKCNKKLEGETMLMLSIIESSGMKKISLDEFKERFHKCA